MDSKGFLSVGPIRRALARARENRGKRSARNREKSWLAQRWEYLKLKTVSTKPNIRLENLKIYGIFRFRFFI